MAPHYVFFPELTFVQKASLSSIAPTFLVPIFLTPLALVFSLTNAILFSPALGSFTPTHQGLSQPHLLFYSTAAFSPKSALPLLVCPQTKSPPREMAHVSRTAEFAFSVQGQETGVAGHLMPPGHHPQQHQVSGLGDEALNGGPGEESHFGLHFLFRTNLGQGP